MRLNHWDFSAISMPLKRILPYFQIFLHNNYGEFVKSRNSIECVIPANPGSSPGQAPEYMVSRENGNPDFL
jgi:cystathionine beta-lyase family protein involved in aluminum resistance